MDKLAKDEDDTGSKDDVLEEAKEAFELAAESEADNRKEALDDLRFARLAEQWPEKQRQQRIADGLPCLTINRLPAFIRQVTNDARQNKPSIKVHPADSDADPHTAKAYDGLIRNIEVTSAADVAYDTALDFAVTMGFGYFRINTDYACDDNFDLDIVIKRVSNPFTVYGDPNSTAADSSDWDTAFIVKHMPKAHFEKKYKGADKVDWEGGKYSKLSAPWREDDEVQVAEYFQREEITKTILLLSDQTIVDKKLYEDRKAEYDAAGITVAGTRPTKGYKVTQRVMSGAEVLETIPWPGKYIPIVPVYGDEVNVEGERFFRGLVRDAKDSQQNFNFWRTASTELVALAPKAPFIGPRGSFKSDSKWATANKKSHPFLEYDPVAGHPPPQRQPFAGIPAGALQEAMNASDDMKSVMGLFDASLGAKSNETSGRAIIARQREGDVSTFNYTDNLSRAIEHCGRIIIDLIPKVYTQDRIIRVLGPQKEVSRIPLGKPTTVPGPDGQPMVDQGTGLPISHIYDLARGKYDLTVETGPSFTTRREEAANQMLELIRAFPAAASVLGDLLAKNLDWPGADEIAERLQKLQQAQMGGGGPDPKVQEAMQQMQQQVQELSQQLQAKEADSANKAEELRIKSYEAETKRLAEINKAHDQRARAYAAGIPQAAE